VPDADNTASEDFVQEYGNLAELDGFARITGLFMGLMIVSEQPQSFSDIAKRLQISRASVSSTSRRLLEAGMIVRVRIKGSRQYHYQLAGNPYAEYTKTSSRIIKRAHRSAQNTLERLRATSPLIRLRLQELDDYYVHRLAAQQSLYAVLMERSESYRKSMERTAKSVAQGRGRRLIPSQRASRDPRLRSK
jgi:DNA-binding transcriptional regulator GbsR (MarR family)